MRNVVMRDMRDYVKKYKGLIVLSVAAEILCFGFLVFSSNIRIDTEELINQPGTTVGWLTIGRYSLALFKRLLGLSVHRPVWSGFLCLLFFGVGANVLTFALYHFSGKREKYPYWVFLLLYVTSNIWSYQFYFSLQQAEVSCAMLLLVVAALLSMRACFLEKGKANLLRILLSICFLVLGLGAYQALAAYYVVICMALFLVMLDGQSFSFGKSEPVVRKRQDRQLLLGIGKLMIQFIIAYAVYHVIANTWFMSSAAYLEGQRGWGRLPLTECVKNVLRTAKNVLLGYGPRNFSFFTAGALLAVIGVILVWRKSKRDDSPQKGLRLVLFYLALLGVLATPFLMTIYMGEMLVTRSQFALPVAAAFLGMYGTAELGKLPGGEKEKRKKWIMRGCQFCVLAAILIQTGYDLRLTYTDEMRYRQDAARTEALLGALQEANGGVLPEQPVIFVGYQKAELGSWCRRTEMYGWSFYEWDYSIANPTGATYRILGFVQAYTGNVLNENATEEEKAAAVELAETMPDFPQDGSVVITEDFAVVRLSEIEERMDNDWW